ncbi:type ii inositol--trisphosphate 5-phosphatase [Phaffia rhodozyma]|uniref:Type ii inositol--trisphosphate 5-phosphatase n=1 Tax=Phaffia rhodozyma TaxID=264483 RepID=A0A0F7SRF4_PHARH|nr:type ii inositol--trisphosphate 5-phosphatase [Phaffia rhodozyma]
MAGVDKQNLHKLFRPTEYLRSFVQGTVVSPAGQPINVILGIVLSSERGEDEGAIFTVICSSDLTYRIQSILPITTSLKISISQYQAKFDKLHPTAVELQFARTEVSAEFMLNFTEKLLDEPPEGVRVRPEQKHRDIEVIVSDLNTTKDLLAEVNRLKSKSDKNQNLSPKVSFAWLAFYSSDTNSTFGKESTLSESQNSPSGLSTKLSNMFVEKEMKARFREWTDECALRIRVGTFNVNGQLPPIGDPSYLSDWITSPDGRPADILAFGFQELDLSVASLVFAPPKNTVGFDGSERAVGRDELWTSALLSGLGDERENYIKLTSKQYVGVLLIVLARKDLHDVGDISTDAVPIGLMGVMGNKAGVGVRLRVQGSYITFVNSHLAAFADQLDKRRLDFEEISRRLKFPFNSDQAIESVGWYGIKSPRSGPVTLAHEEVGLCFWLGDLNYRIDMPEDEGWKLVESKGASALLSKDQLNLERGNGTHFYGFEEGGITFEPTFKYEKESNSFDTKYLFLSPWYGFKISLLIGLMVSTYRYRRLPAWCDRVLWRGSERERVEQVSYTSHPSINFSDHHPVSARYES